jgi:hypothetical protein
METEYIILYIGCGQKEITKKISLGTKEQDDWTESKIQTLTINPVEISSIVVGPKTACEIYSLDNFMGSKYKIVNSSTDKVKTYKIGCPEDTHLIKSPIRSFIVMTYDHYNSIYGIRYCNSHNQCDRNELCLCPGGQENPSWCSKKGRRCMNRGYFTYEFPTHLLSSDTVDSKCLENQLKSYDNNDLTYAVLNQYANKCAFDKRKTIEGFSYKNDSWVATILILVTLLFLVLAIRIAY